MPHIYLSINENMLVFIGIVNCKNAWYWKAVRNQNWL